MPVFNNFLLVDICDGVLGDTEIIEALEVALNSRHVNLIVKSISQAGFSVKDNQLDTIFKLPSFIQLPSRARSKENEGCSFGISSPLYLTMDEKKYAVRALVERAVEYEESEEFFFHVLARLNIMVKDDISGSNMCVFEISNSKCHGKVDIGLSQMNRLFILRYYSKIVFKFTKSDHVLNSKLCKEVFKPGNEFDMIQKSIDLGEEFLREVGKISPFDEKFINGIRRFTPFLVNIGQKSGNDQGSVGLSGISPKSPNSFSFLVNFETLKLRAALRDAMRRKCDFPDSEIQINALLQLHNALASGGKVFLLDDLGYCDGSSLHSEIVSNAIGFECEHELNYLEIENLRTVAFPFQFAGNLNQAILKDTVKTFYACLDDRFIAFQISQSHRTKFHECNRLMLTKKLPFFRRNPEEYFSRLDFKFSSIFLRFGNSLLIDGPSDMKNSDEEDNLFSMGKNNLFSMGKNEDRLQRFLLLNQNDEPILGVYNSICEFLEEFPPYVRELNFVNCFFRGHYDTLNRQKMKMILVAWGSAAFQISNVECEDNLEIRNLKGSFVVTRSKFHHLTIRKYSQITIEDCTGHFHLKNINFEPLTNLKEKFHSNRSKRYGQFLKTHRKGIPPSQNSTNLIDEAIKSSPKKILFEEQDYKLKMTNLIINSGFKITFQSEIIIDGCFFTLIPLVIPQKLRILHVSNCHGIIKMLNGTPNPYELLLKSQSFIFFNFNISIEVVHYIETAISGADVNPETGLKNTIESFSTTDQHGSCVIFNVDFFELDDHEDSSLCSSEVKQ